MKDPDVLLFKGIKFIGDFIHKSFVEPLSVDIGGIPVTAITLLLIMLLIGGKYYEYSVKNSFSLSGRFSKLIQTSETFTRAMLIGAFGLIALILFW